MFKFSLTQKLTAVLLGLAIVSGAAVLIVPFKKKEVYIPEVSQEPQQENYHYDKLVKKEVPESEKININTATKIELMQIPGVGGGLAGRIIDHREDTGVFRDISDLREVKGISENFYIKIRDYVKIKGQSGTASMDRPEGQGLFYAEENASAKVKAAAPVKIIDINTATLRELGKIPGVGDVTARRIFEYRKANGPFSAKEDLMKVQGIGKKSFERLKEAITVSEAAAPRQEGGRLSKGGGQPIDINRAGVRELEKIPGVGEVTARRIFEYRKANGPFSVVEDLLKVPGIGEGSFEKMRDSVTASPAAKAAKPPAGGGKDPGIVVDLNKATVKQLVKIPGVGDVTAKRIIAYREANGAFTSKEELLKVEGISPRFFESIKNNVSAGE